MDRATRMRVITSLKIAILKVGERNQTHWVNIFREMLQQAEIGLDVEGLEETRPVLKAILGYDPLEGKTGPAKDGRAVEPVGDGAPEKLSLQDLKREIYTKAKAEPDWRFWGLFVHVTKKDTLREAYGRVPDDSAH